MKLNAATFFEQAQDYLNFFNNIFESPSSTCPMDYTNSEVLSHFKGIPPETTKGIDGYDPSSPFSYISSFVDHQNRPIELARLFYKRLNIKSIQGLAELWTLARPCHCSEASGYIPYLIKNEAPYHHDIPIEAQLLLDETHGMLLYYDQAFNLLNMFFSLTHMESTLILKDWKKGKNTDMYITPRDHVSLTDAEKLILLLSTRAGTLFPRGHAIRVATYHYKQMFLKVHDPDWFFAWHYWLECKYSEIEDDKVYIQIDLN